ncbi:histidine phosphatase family protein (plasmid) [Photobacterium sp. GJ3]|uniref:histidine phosphatase family protein n=1 Tax=Photobacterium sp. GJ3 TaxID=2829502 RepID=UPI001B8BA707|nr:histidine phosphatase family protein [Photobacterium sp. GJ3]QUJ70199.1 histidine phosphatase family protein [Photobacterium sp. GJ3]
MNTCEKSYTVTLIRHGKVNGPPALYGTTDIAVSETVNHVICRQIQSQPIPFDVIITSPLRRCQSLAELLRGSTPLITASGFQEIDFGELDGQPFESLTPHSQTWQRLEQFWDNPASHPLPEAESLDHFFCRVQSTWAQTIATHRNDLLIVTHGGVIRAILADVLGLDWRNPKWYSTLNIANGSLTQIQVTHSEHRIYFAVKQIGSVIPVQN